MLTMRSWFSIYIAQLPNTKTKISREFFVTVGKIQGPDIVEIPRKYLALRPQHTNHGRLFVEYRKGFCTVQPIHINTVGSMLKDITTFFNLSDPKEYTGLYFVRTVVVMKGREKIKVDSRPTD